MSSKLGLLCVVLLLYSGIDLMAQRHVVGKVYWQFDGIPLYLASGSPGNPQLATDGANGAIAVWHDCHSSTVDCDIFAQRLNGNDGGLVWGASGIPVSTEVEGQFSPKIISDGFGGALIVWTDYRNHADYSVYAQRLDSNGQKLWAEPGIPVAVDSGNQIVLNLISDTVGGAFIIWQEWLEPLGTMPTDINLFAQHIDNSGELLWTMPITITAASGIQGYGDSSPDNLGGFLVTWADWSNENDPNIYAQRISAEGDPVWMIDGSVVTDNPALQRAGYIVPDENGGAFVTWYDFRSNHNLADAFMQRMSSTGIPAWTTDLPVVAMIDLAEGPSDLITDGNGGSILIASRSYLGVVEVDVVAQRIGVDGQLIWGENPVNVTDWEAQQEFGRAVPDNNGGAYIVWLDSYSDEYAYDIWAQHLGSDGNLLWSEHGVQVVGEDGLQGLPIVISDNQNGIIVAWRDYRFDPDVPDLYVQRVGDILLQNHYFLPIVRK